MESKSKPAREQEQEQESNRGKREQEQESKWRATPLPAVLDRSSAQLQQYHLLLTRQQLLCSSIICAASVPCLQQYHLCSSCTMFAAAVPCGQLPKSLCPHRSQQPGLVHTWLLCPGAPSCCQRHSLVNFHRLPHLLIGKSSRQN